MELLVVVMSGLGGARRALLREPQLIPTVTARCQGASLTSEPRASAGAMLGHSHRTASNGADKQRFLRDGRLGHRPACAALAAPTLTHQLDHLRFRALQAAVQGAEGKAAGLAAEPHCPSCYANSWCGSWKAPVCSGFPLREHPYLYYTFTVSSLVVNPHPRILAGLITGLWKHPACETPLLGGPGQRCHHLCILST